MAFHVKRVAWPPTAEPRARIETPATQLVGAISRRWWIIAAVWLATVVIVNLVSVSMAPFYESRAVIQVGQIRGDDAKQQPIEAPALLVERLKERYDVGDRGATGTGLPALADVRLDKNSKSLVLMTARGRTPAEARGFLATVVDGVLADHGGTITRKQEERQQLLRVVDDQLARLQREISSIDGRLKRASVQQPAMALGLATRRNDLLRDYLELQREKVEITNEIDQLQASPSKTLRAPTSTDQPAGLGKGAVAMLSVIFGLLAGITAGLVAHLVMERRLRDPEALYK